MAHKCLADKKWVSLDEEDIRLGEATIVEDCGDCMLRKFGGGEFTSEPGDRDD